MRLQKALALAGFGSRRGLEDLIREGRITVNGVPATLGVRVGPGDRVCVEGRQVRLRFDEAQARVLIYHKPAGEIVTRHDPEGRPTVFDRLPPAKGTRWVVVGRLDFNTEGLLLFTTSGDLAHRMMHPRYNQEREYAVRLRGELSKVHAQQLLKGVELEDGMARLDRLEPAGSSESHYWYRATLREGRNREVRRLFEALGYMVSRLIRVRYGTILLPPNLQRGRWRELVPAEVNALAPPPAASPGTPGEARAARGKARQVRTEAPPAPARRRSLRRRTTRAR